MTETMGYAVKKGMQLISYIKWPKWKQRKPPPKLLKPSYFSMWAFLNDRSLSYCKYHITIHNLSDINLSILAEVTLCITETEKYQVDTWIYI